MNDGFREANYKITTHLNTILWQVWSQGYGQSIVLTVDRSKYQSPTDCAILCTFKGNKLNIDVFLSRFHYTCTYDEMYFKMNDIPYDLLTYRIFQ